MLKNLKNFPFRKFALRQFCQTKLFSELPNISSQTVKNLSQHGYEKMTKIQQATYDQVFNRTNLIARDKTGQGKTLAFALPIVERLRQEKKFQKQRGPLVLVITPTRELAIQIHEQFLKLKNYSQEFEASVIFGGSGERYVLSQLKNKRVDVLIGTPGKIIDQINKKNIILDNLETLVLDETDNMLNMGFEEDINQIFKQIPQENMDDVQCVLFSATIPSWVTQISQRSFNKKFQRVNMVQKNDQDIPQNIENYYCSVENEKEKQRLLTNIVLNQLKKKLDSKILIFSNKKQNIKNIQQSSYFMQQISATFSSDLSQTHRQFCLLGFRQGIFKCLICTDVASRGLDIDDVDLVIQYDLPQDREQFVHRTGRVGRMNKKGTNIFFVSDKDEFVFRRIKKEFNFRYRNYDDYVEENFLEETKEQNIHQSLDQMDDDEMISVKIKSGDKSLSKEQKSEQIQQFLNYLEEENFQLEKFQLLEDNSAIKSFKTYQNIFHKIRKGDLERLQNAAQNYENQIRIYPQSQMYIEAKRILLQLDEGDIDISQFFIPHQIIIKNYSNIPVEKIEILCEQLKDKEVISQVPVIQERASLLVLSFPNKKDTCRFLKATENLKIDKKTVVIQLNYRLRNSFSMNQKNRQNRYTQSQDNKDESIDNKKENSAQN